MSDPTDSNLVSNVGSVTRSGREIRGQFPKLAAEQHRIHILRDRSKVKVISALAKAK